MNLYRMFIWIYTECMDMNSYMKWSYEFMGYMKYYKFIYEMIKWIHEYMNSCIWIHMYRTGVGVLVWLFG